MLNPLELKITDCGFFHTTVLASVLKLDRSRVNAYMDNALANHGDCRVVEALLADVANETTLRHVITWLAGHSSPLLDMDVGAVFSLLGPDALSKFGINLKISDVVSIVNAYAGGDGKLRDVVRALQGDDDMIREISSRVAEGLGNNVHEGEVVSICSHCGEANIYEGDVRSEITICRHCSGINIRSLE